LIDGQNGGVPSMKLPTRRSIVAASFTAGNYLDNMGQI
jgi:hypothetical protein